MGPSSNGSKDSHPYSSFGRSRRDRERDVESRGRDRVRDRKSQIDDRFYGRSELYNANSKDKDRSRRSQSMEPGRQIESRLKKSGNGVRNGVVSGSGGIGGISRASFDRDFPSLGPGLPDRVSSPGIATVVPCTPMSSLPVIRADGWTSALVDVPAPQTPTATTGLKMAEALAQAPRVRTPPQLSKAEELARRQSKLLIPVTPSMPKTLAVNSSERSKSKGTSLPKFGQQASSQLVNHALHAPLTSDTPKTSQAGNFQVLSRENSLNSPNAKEIPGGRATNPPGDAVPLKTNLSPKPKPDSKGNTLSSPHRSLSQARNRNDFFNTLRKKASMNHLTVNCEAINPDKFGEESSGTCPSTDPEDHALATDSGFDDSVVNESGVTELCERPERNEETESCSNLVINLDKEKSVDPGFDSCVENDNGITESDPSESPERIPSGGDKENKSCPGLVIDVEKEQELLKLFGWKEDAKEEALTAEEIEAYYEKHGNVKPSLKYSHRVGGGSPGLYSSGCKAEA